jgi:transcriptional regulator with XRE-family HTH domain
MTVHKNKQLVAIGSQIRHLRMARGYSQEDFAMLVGLHRAYYGGIERGERNISLLNLIRIAVALDAEVGELFPALIELKDGMDASTVSAEALYVLNKRLAKGEISEEEYRRLRRMVEGN